MIVYFEEPGIVHMGDLLISQSFPSLTRGEKIPQYLDILEKVFDIFPESTRFIAGHGRDLTKKEFKTYQKMLLTTIEIVKTGIKAGKTIEDMQKEKVLKDYESYNSFIPELNTDFWIGAVYRNYLNSTVTLDVSSLKSVLLKSDKILDHPDHFWEDDGAYNLAKKWHDINKIPLDTLNYYNTWIERIEEISHLSEAQKQNHPSLQLMNDILERKKIFDERALPHICSFLPKNNVNLNTTIYLTGHTLAWAFMTHSNIVINVLHPHYKGKNADYFMNTIVHEVFHIGYGKNRSYRTEIELENFNIYDMLDSFHNEGMAVYTAYKAQKFFPAPDEKDYVLLEDSIEVKRLLDNLNEFFPKAGSLSEDALRQQAGDLGVSQRAYYVVGSLMAKTIDEKAGREVLIETIEKGPMSFISTYNQLVKPELQVYEFKLPDTLSVYQSLKQAVLNDNLSLFNDLKMKIVESDVSTDLEGKLNSLGYNMLHHQKNEWAIRVFILNVDLFSESANAYDSLGEAYMKNGDKNNAIINYKKSLELNTKNQNAKQMLKKLEHNK